MTEKTSLFGSWGLLSDLDRREAGDVVTRRPAFGKRRGGAYHSVSFHQIRLTHMCEELRALFEDGDVSGEFSRFKVISAEEPQLRIGETAVVQIDAETGLYVFQEQTPHSGVIVVTASEDRILDHIICHLAAGSNGMGTETVNQATRMLVGRTLADIERRLILQTLRHCHGNRTHTSEMLGISLRTVRNKLRSYWLESTTGEEAQQ